MTVSINMGLNNKSVLIKDVLYFFRISFSFPGFPFNVGNLTFADNLVLCKVYIEQGDLKRMTIDYLITCYYNDFLAFDY